MLLFYQFWTVQSQGTNKTKKKTGADLLSQPSCCDVSKFWSFHRQIKIQVCIGENDRQIDPDFVAGSFAYKKNPDYFPIDVEV